MTTPTCPKVTFVRKNAIEKIKAYSSMCDYLFIAVKFDGAHWKVPVKYSKFALTGVDTL